MTLKLITAIGTALAIALAILCLGPFFLFGELVMAAKLTAKEGAR